MLNFFLLTLHFPVRNPPTRRVAFEGRQWAPKTMCKSINSISPLIDILHASSQNNPIFLCIHTYPSLTKTVPTTVHPKGEILQLESLLKQASSFQTTVVFYEMVQVLLTLQICALQHFYKLLPIQIQETSVIKALSSPGFYKPSSKYQTSNDLL